MPKTEKKELTEKLQSAILNVLREINPTLAPKMKKEAGKSGKVLTKKLLEIQEELEKKAKSAAKNQAKADSKSKKGKKKDDPKDGKGKQDK